MILIVGQNGDSSTHEVLRYLMYWNAPFIKISDLDTIDNVSIQCTNRQHEVTISKDSMKVNLSKVSAYWYRRGNLVFQYKMNATHPEIAESEIHDFVKKEYSTIANYIHYCLEQIGTRIGAFSKNNINKLIQLQYAKEVKLLIPRFIISNNRKEVQRFYNDVGTLATKGIGNNFTNLSGQSYWMFTSLIQQKDIDRFSEKFAYTLFQQYVEKEYEIRVFYLHGKCYSMAIFSQQNPDSMIDYRRMRAGRSNRTVPYNLPKVVENKIIRFMKKCEMNTGSIDLIFTSKGEYCFLEVNPNGQFGMVSKPCNYFIERDIANYLKEGVMKNE
ncbi:MAG: grasp-with-spasm system ATP-grasp peptide maturase [Bacteroidia bacterium]|nr:grasp-with-spasm system ATP-grasp peptide maturase [Bacteroidia bacterium]